MSAKVITIFSNKGGVGKTFIGVNIACALAIKGKRVLIVDLNLQASQDMARMLNLPPTHCLVDILADTESPDVIRKHIVTHSSGLHLLPGVKSPRKIGISRPTICACFSKKHPANM